MRLAVLLACVAALVVALGSCWWVTFDGKPTAVRAPWTREIEFPATDHGAHRLRAWRPIDGARAIVAARLFEDGFVNEGEIEMKALWGRPPRIRLGAMAIELSRDGAVVRPIATCPGMHGPDYWHCNDEGEADREAATWTAYVNGCRQKIGPSGRNWGSECRLSIGKNGEVNADMTVDDGGAMVVTPGR